MNNKEKQMNKVILIMGHLASGKTTYAKRLASELNLFYFCKDDIKELLVNEVGFKDRAENLKLSNATFAILSHAITNLSNQGILLLESNFKYHELNILKSNHPETSFLTIFLTGNEDLLYQRYLGRQEHRHIAHKSMGLISFEVFKASMFEYQPDNMIGNSYYFETTGDNNHYEDIKNIVNDFITL